MKPLATHPRHRRDQRAQAGRTTHPRVATQPAAPPLWPTPRHHCRPQTVRPPAGRPDRRRPGPGSRDRPSAGAAPGPDGPDPAAAGQEPGARMRGCPRPRGQDAGTGPDNCPHPARAQARAQESSPPQPSCTEVLGQSRAAPTHGGGAGEPQVGAGGSPRPGRAEAGAGAGAGTWVGGSPGLGWAKSRCRAGGDRRRAATARDRGTQKPEAEVGGSPGLGWAWRGECGVIGSPHA